MGRSYTHKARLNGKLLPLGLNLDAVVLEGGPLRAGWTLFQKMRSKRATHVCIDDGIALLSRKKAFVMGNAVKNWRVNAEQRLFLPLDDDVVYVAELEPVGDETAIVNGTERMVSVDEARSLAASEFSGLIMVNETASYHELKDVGLEAVEQLFDQPKTNFCRRAFFAFALAKLVHPLHLAVLFFLVGAFALMPHAMPPPPEVVIEQKVREAGGERRLDNDLRRLAKAQTTLRSLRAHGVSKAEANKRRVVASGKFSANSFGSLQRFADVRSGRLVVLGTGWEITWDLPDRVMKDEVELISLRKSLKQFYQAATEINLVPVIQAYTDGGSDILSESLRIIRNYREATFNVRVDGMFSKLNPLADAIERTEVAGELLEIEWLFSDGVLQSTNLTIKVRGRDEKTY